MVDLWPWLALAGLGALHGLSPANGWMFAAAWACMRAAARRRGVPCCPSPSDTRHRSHSWLCAVALGMAMDRAWVQHGAGALLVGAAALRMLRGAGRVHTNRHAGRPRRHRWWSFLMATAHGAGLMLVPALVPLCLADNPAREITASGSLLLAAAAVGVHTAAMLVTTGVVATVVCPRRRPAPSPVERRRRRAKPGPPHWPSPACC